MVHHGLIPSFIKYCKKNLAGVGTQTAALAFGGFSTGALSATESYNGSSWTSVNSMNTARRA
jgi:hypothetical protein